MRLIDTHAHLDFPALAEQLDEVLAHAHAQGVERVVAIGASRGLESNWRALQIARDHPERVRCTAGIHPHDADMATAQVLQILDRELAPLPEVVALGETGLDYHYNRSAPEQQRAVFEATLRMAASHGKPVIIHSRDAEADTLAMLRDSGLDRGIIHCFSGSPEFAQGALALGFSISFSGIVTFKTGQALLEIARDVPKERLLIETDSPYLAPVPHRGKTNQPAYVRYTAQAIAQIRQLSLEALAEQTWRNACAMFGWPSPEDEGV